MLTKIIRKQNSKVAKSKLRSVFTFFIFLSFSAFLIGCGGPGSLYEDYKNIPNQIWLEDSVISFEIDIDKVEKPVDLALTMRYGLSYAYNNVYVDYRLTKEDGSLIKKELLDIILFDPKSGKPLGGGMSDVFDIEHQFLNSYNFPEAGKYKVSLQHYMRVNELPEIISVGLKVSEPVND